MRNSPLFSLLQVVVPSLALTALCIAVPSLAQNQAPVTSQTAPVRPLGSQEPSNPQLAPLVPRKKMRLFNGKDFTELYTFLPSRGVNNDPDRVFTILPDGSMHVSGQEFGYFATVSNYANYRLTFQVKWGEKRWPPRENAVRDAGVLVLCVPPEQVWIKSFECQIQENDFGDVFHIGGISSVVNGKRQNDRVIRTKMAEKPRGEWNTLEIRVRDNTVTSIVNGVVEHIATDITRERDGKGGPLNQGRIAFQSEGAEVYYRNIEIAPL